MEKNPGGDLLLRDPVSYTHLDVYKRQLLPFMLWSSWSVFSNNVVNYEEIQTLIQQSMVHLPSFAAPLVFLLSILFIPSLLIQLIWLYRAFRTYSGPRYVGGYSDHLPLYLDLFFRKF